MPKYKDGKDAVVGHTVKGIDKDGKPVEGMLVMIHRVSAKDLPDIAVSQNQRLIGDLKASDFVLVENPETKSPSGPAPEQKR